MLCGKNRTEGNAMNIKKNLTKLFFLLPIALFVLIFLRLDSTSPKSFAIFAMDTYADFKIWGGKDSTQKNKDLLSDFDKRFSMYSDGELSMLNKSSGNFKASDELFNIIDISLKLSKQYGNSVDISSGALTRLWGVSSENPRVPSESEILKAVKTTGHEKISLNEETKEISLQSGTEIDLGSVAKGYACDKLKEIYEDSNVSCAIASLGSSSLLYGKKPDGSEFSVEIKNPDGGAALGVIKTGETFLSTSGGYERFFEVNGKKYCHIFDVSTGYPAESGLTSVTVLCDSGIKSDFLSTLIFIEGKDGLKKHLSAKDYSIVAVTDDKKIYVSPDINFEIYPESGYTLGETK